MENIAFFDNFMGALVFVGIFVFVMFIGYLVDPKLRNFINKIRK